MSARSVATKPVPHMVGLADWSCAESAVELDFQINQILPTQKAEYNLEFYASACLLQGLPNVQSILAAGTTINLNAIIGKEA